MYYNRILRLWILDRLDYFSLGVIVGSIISSRIKSDLSEKKAMEPLKNSIIKKSKLVLKSDRPISNSNEIRIKRIYKFALENGKLLLELILYKCRIDISYWLLTEVVNPQVILRTVIAGGIAGFTTSWFSASTSLLAPSVLILILSIRGVAQQIVNQSDYTNYRKLYNQMFEDDELTQTTRAFFIEQEVATATDIEMKYQNTAKNPLTEAKFNSDPTWEEFIKARMKEELGVIENSSPKKLKEIKHSRKIKRKIGYFKDLIDEIAEDPADIIDAEIVKQPIRVKVKKEEL